ncbi:MAG: Rieske 2Fe-2S domain-containing protein [Pseudomonadota bacterium]
MSANSSMICIAEQIEEGGKGARFKVVIGGKPQAAFVIRFDGKAHAFVNCCPHVGTELDWEPGEFFDFSGLYLVCATHGAAFMPNSGYCTSGPCKGQRLTNIPVTERDGAIFLNEGFTLYVE